MSVTDSAFSLPTSQSITDYYGLKIYTNEELENIIVTKDGSSTSTECKIVNTSNTVLETVSYSGNTATFSITLAKNTTYYIVSGAAGSHTMRRNNSVSYPKNGTNVNFVDNSVSFVGGVIASAGATYAMEVLSVTSDVVIPVVTPVASFTATPLSGYPNLSVTFTDTSTNTPTSWSWEKKETGSYEVFSTDQNPTIDIGLGTWDIKLTATNIAGSDSEEKLDYITTTAKPITILPMSGTKHRFSNSWKFQNRWKFKFF